MATAKRSLLWCVIGTTAFAGCVEEPVSTRAYGPPALGGYDKNSPFFDDGFDDLATGLDFDPGISTLSSANDFAFQWSDEVVPECGLPGLQRDVDVVGTRTYGTKVVGSDLMIDDHDVWRSLESGERVTFMARMVNSAGYDRLVVLDVTRGPSLHTVETPNLWWPQFDLRIEDAESCEAVLDRVVILGAPIEVPLDGGPIGVRADAFGAYTSYFKDQRPSLVAKVMINGPLPTRFSWEDRDGLVRACGTTQDVDPGELVRTAAFALGHAVPVRVPTDSDRRTVLAMMTEEGRLVKLHGSATTAQGDQRGLCFGPRFPAGLVGAPLPRLMQPPAIASLVTPIDVVEVASQELQASDVPTSRSVLVATGGDRSRRDAYLASSKNEWREQFVAQLDEEIAATHLGDHQGAFDGWLTATRVVASRSRLLVATEPAPSWFSVVLGDALAPAATAMLPNCGNDWCSPVEVCPQDCDWAYLNEAQTIHDHGGPTDPPAASGLPAPDVDHAETIIEALPAPVPGAE